MNTHETYVSLETAKLLKKAGFDWEIEDRWDYCHPIDRWDLRHWPEKPVNWNEKERETVYKYEPSVSAPTLAVAQKWFREEKNISIDIKSDKQGNYDFIVHRINMVDYTLPSVLCVSACNFYTYEEALEDGIQNALVPLLNDEKRTSLVISKDWANLIKI